jgi:hypothetical protein
MLSGQNMELVAQDILAHETSLRVWLDRTLSDDRIEHNMSNNDYYGVDRELLCELLKSLGVRLCRCCTFLVDQTPMLF